MLDLSVAQCCCVEKAVATRLSRNLEEAESRSSTVATGRLGASSGEAEFILPAVAKNVPALSLTKPPTTQVDLTRTFGNVSFFARLLELLSEPS